MTLREQLRELASRKINPALVEFCGDTIDPYMRVLVSMAFFERWEEGRDTRILRRVGYLMDRPRMPWVEPDEPGVE